jgi:pimeloyl-ACP methyl ester carboxylesterase
VDLVQHGCVRGRLSACLLLAAVLAAGGAGQAGAEGSVGTTFPEGFDVPVDASLGAPVIGFGAAGLVRRTPVVFLHGNNDTPYPTSCNGSYGAPRAFAQYFADRGYAVSELWGLGYQGDQCDLLANQSRRAGPAHTTVANVPDVRAFVRSVLAFTGASQVDVVGHSLGATLAREWMREDGAHALVRRLVSIDGPHHGILNCSPSPLNYYVTLGFTPDSPVCQEYGAADTAFLQRLNADGETVGPTEYLAVVNVDASFVYISTQDGVLPAVPAQDRQGRPHDFSRSAVLDGARLLEVRGQGVHDSALRAAHTGVVASPEVWQATLDFLAPVQVQVPAAGPAAAPLDAPEAAAPARASSSPSETVAAGARLPATGGLPTGAVALLVLGAGAACARRCRG